MTPAEKKAAKADYDREYRRKNAEKLKAAKALWGKSDAKKAGDRKWVHNNRERSREIKAAWRARNPDAAPTKEQRAITARAYRARNAEQLRQKQNAYGAANKEEIAIRVAARHAANPEPGRARTKAWTKANPEQKAAADKAYYEANKARLSAQNKAWKLANKDRVYASNHARARRVRQATPPWADKTAIRLLYLTAQRLGQEVDHIIPLNGELVSGLHVVGNLQLISATENRRKGNKYAN